MVFVEVTPYNLPQNCVVSVVPCVSHFKLPSDCGTMLHILFPLSSAVLLFSLHIIILFISSTGIHTYWFKLDSANVWSASVLTFFKSATPSTSDVGSSSYITSPPAIVFSPSISDTTNPAGIGTVLPPAVATFDSWLSLFHPTGKFSETVTGVGDILSNSAKYPFSTVSSLDTASSHCVLAFCACPNKSPPLIATVIAVPARISNTTIVITSAISVIPSIFSFL